MSKPIKSPFTLISERASRRLEMFFRRCIGRNAVLFVDPGLDKVIGRIVPIKSIKESYSKVFTYMTNRTNFDYEVITILTNGETCHIQEYVKLLTETNKPPSEINIIFTNRFTFVTRQFFEQEGFLHRFTYEELRLPMWILDADMATLEMDNSFLNVLMYGGRKCVEQVSEAIKMIPSHDYFSNIFCIGNNAIEIGKSLPPNFQSGWSHIIIVDRTVDLVTPFLTPFTYEAVVAEYVGIKYGIVKIGDSQETVVFSTDDPISSSTRLMSIPEASAQIKELASTIQKEFAELKKETAINKKTLMLKDVAERVVVDNQSIGMHLQVLEACTDKGALKEPAFKPVLNYELECITGAVKDLKMMDEITALASDWRMAVKLLCSYCQTAKIVPDLDLVRQNIIDRFGLDALTALWTLEEAGIVKAGRKNIWPSLSKKLKLFTEDVEVGPPVVYSGHIPLFLRIVEKALKKQWNDVSITLQEVGIPYQCFGNRTPDLKRALVVFVGGAMYGEITALRKNTSLGVAVDVIATEVLSTNKILSQLAGVEQL